MFLALCCIIKEVLYLTYPSLKWTLFLVLKLKIYFVNVHLRILPIITIFTCTEKYQFFTKILICRIYKLKNCWKVLFWLNIFENLLLIIFKIDANLAAKVLHFRMIEPIFYFITKSNYNLQLKYIKYLNLKVFSYL